MYVNQTKTKQEFKEHRRQSKLLPKKSNFTEKDLHSAAIEQQDKLMNNNVSVKGECSAHVIVRIYAKV